MDIEPSELVNEIFECTSLIIDAMDPDDSYDRQIILSALDCCSTALNLQKKKRTKRKERRRPKRSVMHAVEEDEPRAFASITREMRVISQSARMKEFLNVPKYKMILELMSPGRFEMLLGLVKRDVQCTNTVMKEAINPADKLAATLRFLITGESYKITATATGFSTAYLCRAVPEVCKAIWNNLKVEHMKFPASTAEWEKIAEEFNLKWQFPNCLGAIDGKHIMFRAQQKDGDFYQNYMGSHSIMLLALVDANCKFIYVDVGCNGRSTEADALEISKLNEVLENAEQLFPPDKVVGDSRYLPYVLIGDELYPLRRNLMPPYPYSTESPSEQIFNIRLSWAKHVVEYAFGILPHRFRIFENAMNLRVESVENITLACCVLHNFLLEDDEYHKGYSYIYSTATEDIGHLTLIGIDYPAEDEAYSIRQSFTSYFNAEGAVEWQDSHCS